MEKKSSGYQTGIASEHLVLSMLYRLGAKAYLTLGNEKSIDIRITKDEMVVASSDVNIDFILDERARELVGEYKRWMDLKRTGKLIERTLAHNNLAARENKMDEHILVRPIPQSVIDQTEGEISQNDKY